MTGKKISLAFFITALLYTLFLHIILGMDSFWDTDNYHYYIGWSAANLKTFVYGALAQYHTYLNPLIDTLNYLTFSTSSYLGAAFHSFIFASSLFIVYQIYLKMHESLTMQLRVLGFFVTAIGASAAMSVSLFGSFTNEHQIALIVLFAFWLVIQNREKHKFKRLFVSGFCVGCAIGFKLTSITYFSALILTATLVEKNHLKAFLYLSLGATVGLLLTDGPYMVMRWREFGNPIFPFANNLFHSPYFSTVWFEFSKFELGKIFYYLSLPFRWLYSRDFVEGDVNQLRDARFLLGYIGLFLFIFSILIQKYKPGKKEVQLVVFYILIWIFWILLFRIYRYLVVLELLSGVIFSLGVQRILAKRKEKLSVWLIIISALLGVSLTTIYPSWGRRPWDNNFIRVDMPTFNKRDVVFLTEWGKLSCLVPAIKNAKFATMYTQQSWYEGDKTGYPMDKREMPLPKIEHLKFLQISIKDPRTTSRFLQKLVGSRYYLCQDVSTNLGVYAYVCRYSYLEEALHPLQINHFYNHRCGEDIQFLYGWSGAEPDIRWSEGKKASLLFIVPQGNKDKYELMLSGNTLGLQKIKIFINKKQILFDDFNGEITLRLPFHLNTVKQKAIVQVDFEFPLGRRPDNGDHRILAFALKGLTLKSVNCE